jgi:asparagine synthase (glutamine-hydrolysing)
MFDESSYAQLVAKAAGADATFVTPRPGSLLDQLDDVIWHQDEPFLSASIFAQWCVFEAARQAGVTVMLDGQGADESLGGYRGFFGAYLSSLIRQGRVAQWLREAAAMRRGANFSWVRSLGYTAAYLDPYLLRILGRFEGRAYSDRAWVHQSCRDAFDSDPVSRLGGRSSDVRSMSIAQLTATNLPMLLRWEDRNSMAFSVEARVPFLDYRFVELALGLPDDAKVGGGVSKRALRQAMRGTVPDAVLDRKDKMGFVTAEATWVTRTAPDRMRQLLEESALALQDVVVPAQLMQKLDEMCAGARPYDHRIWRVIVAGRWIRRFGLSLA